MSRPYRDPGRSRRPSRRRWLTLHSLILGGLIALLAGAGINGWRWLPSGRTVLNQVQQAGERLPAVGRLGQRVLFVSPHPDDETLAAAGILQDVQQHGGQVYVVFLTSGDGFPWGGAAP